MGKVCVGVGVGGSELEKRVAGEMAGQRKGFLCSVTVYIPGMDEKAKGGREGKQVL